MTDNKTRKTDRRTLYTQTVIKDALLELLAEMSFDRITVASLCRQAEITRPTFYLHYDNLMQVLDGLIDDNFGPRPEVITRQPLWDDRKLLSDLSTLEGLEEKLTLSPCQRGASDPKYAVLFEDPVVHNYIVDRMYRERLVSEGAHIMKEYGLSKKLTEKLVNFLVYGSFAMNRAFRWKRDRDWFKAHRMMLTFLAGGFEAIKRDAQLREE